MQAECWRIRSGRAVQVGGLLPLLERIYSAPLILNQVMLDEGLSNLGDTRRLERAMHKLVTGALCFCQL